MSAWAVYRGEHDNDPHHPMWRRFGRDHAAPCLRADVLTCALSACQRLNRCQESERPTEAQIGAAA